MPRQRKPLSDYETAQIDTFWNEYANNEKVQTRLAELVTIALDTKIDIEQYTAANPPFSFRLPLARLRKETYTNTTTSYTTNVRTRDAMRQLQWEDFADRVKFEQKKTTPDPEPFRAVTVTTTGAELAKRQMLGEGVYQLRDFPKRYDVLWNPDEVATILENIGATNLIGIVTACAVSYNGKQYENVCVSLAREPYHNTSLYIAVV